MISGPMTQTSGGTKSGVTKITGPMQGNAQYNPPVQAPIVNKPKTFDIEQGVSGAMSKVQVIAPKVIKVADNIFNSIKGLFSSPDLPKIDPLKIGAVQTPKIAQEINGGETAKASANLTPKGKDVMKRVGEAAKSATDIINPMTAKEIVTGLVGQYVANVKKAGGQNFEGDPNAKFIPKNQKQDLGVLALDFINAFVEQQGAGINQALNLEGETLGASIQASNKPARLLAVVEKNLSKLSNSLKTNPLTFEDALAVQRNVGTPEQIANFKAAQQAGSLSEILRSSAKGEVKKNSTIFSFVKKLMKGLDDVSKTVVDSEPKLLTDGVNKTQFTPGEVTKYVVDNGLGNTAEGKELMKSVIEAQQAGMEIKIVPDTAQKALNIELVPLGPDITAGAETTTTKAVTTPKRAVEEYIDKKSVKFRTEQPKTKELVNYVEPSVYADSLPNAKVGPKKLISELKVPMEMSTNTNPTQVEAVISSIQAGDKINPIVIDDNNVVLDGAHRLEALRKMGVKDVTTVVQSANKIDDSFNGIKSFKTSVDNAYADTKFRLKDDLEKIGVKINDAQEKELVELNKKMFGDTDVKVTGQIIANQKALGSYQDKMIQILDGQANPKDTLYHEAVHKYLDVFTTREEHIAILEEAQRIYGLDDFSQVEEKIAEDFISYAKNREGVLGKIREFFDKLVDRVRSYFKEDVKVKQLYKDILEGKGSATVEKAATEVKVPRAQLPVGEGKEVASRLEARVKGVLDTVNPDVIDQLGLETYNKMNNQDTIAKAVDYITQNPDDAMKVLTGEIDAPKGLPTNAIYVAMVNNASDDIELATKLATLKSTRLGQEIEILKEIDPTSPVKAISSLYKIREAAVETKLGKSVNKAKAEVVKSIEAKMKKVAPQKDAWDNFIAEIECGGI